MSSPGGVVFRGEMFKLGWAVQSVATADPGTSAYTNVFGVVQSATLPDPSVETFPIYAMGTSSYRNPYVIYQGKVTLSGSIPDIWLLNGKTLGLAVGTDTCTATAAPYTHIIAEQCAGSLPMIAVHATQMKSDCNTGLMRRWFGGKVSRMTIEGAEGDFLKASIDEIVFANFQHDISGEATYYGSAISDITPSYPTSQPYLFSYGSLELNSSVFARIRNFRLEINNNLEPKYYIQNTYSGLRLPYEYREGKRDYRLSCQVDLEDNTLYQELCRMGTYSSVYKGFTVKIQFVRGENDKITLVSPASTTETPTTPSGGGDAMGCLIRTAPHNIVTDPIVSTTLDIQMRNLGIIVVDSLPDYGY